MKKPVRPSHNTVVKLTMAGTCVCQPARKHAAIGVGVEHIHRAPKVFGIGGIINGSRAVSLRNCGRNCGERTEMAEGMELLPRNAECVAGDELRQVAWPKREQVERVRLRLQ